MDFVTALALFGAITLALVGFSIMRTYAVHGFGYGFSSNRPANTPSPFELRLKRTLQNQTEAAAYIVPVLVAANFAELTASGAQLAALLIVIGRALFVPLYLSGVTFLRVPAFALASLSTIYLLVLILT